MEPDEVAAKEFVTVMRGYDRDEVRQLLRELALEFDRRDRAIRALEEEVAGVSRLDRSTLVSIMGADVQNMLEDADRVAARITVVARARTSAAAEKIADLRDRLSELRDQIDGVLARTDTAAAHLR